MTNGATNFEELYRRFEETVRRLETGGLGLEESIALYEEASVLATRCRELLDGAEVRIRQLQERYAPDTADPASPTAPPPTGDPSGEGSSAGLWDRLTK